MAKGNSNPQLNAAMTNLTSRVNAPQGLLNDAPPSLAPQNTTPGATTPQIAGLLTPDAPSAAAPGLLMPDPTPQMASGGDLGQGAGVGKTLAQMEAERNAAGIPTPMMPTGPTPTLAQQLATLGLPGITSFGGPPTPLDSAPLTSGGVDLGPSYTDKAIGSDAPPLPTMKNVGGVNTGAPPQLAPPQLAPPPAAPGPQSSAPDSEAPLAQTAGANQAAVADALSRLRAAQAAGYPPSSLFRRASPAGAYQ